MTRFGRVATTSYRGKSVILTGASAGIGRAVGLALARRGARLALAARDEARLAEVAAACEAAGGEAIAVPTDVRSAEQCQTLVARTVAALGGVDAVVNNAGMSMWARLEDIRDLSIYEQIMRVNYLGAVYLTAAALPYLKQRRGRIVAVSSVAGMTGVPTRTGYAASKHALFGFFDSLRIELRAAGVGVTLVAPDFVVSEIHRRSLGADGRPLGKSPMQEAKIMTTERCAEMIVTAMEKGKRLVIGSWRGRAGRWVRLLAPDLIDRMAARAIRQGK
jgi:short-subunit dehydrogenase